MKLKGLLASTNIKTAVITVALVTNALVWYYFVIGLLDSAVQAVKIDQSIILLNWIIHFSSIALSALIGASFAKKLNDRVKCMNYWMMSGLILSVIAVFLDLTSLPVILAFSLLFGLSLGFGMPSCMGYFAETISIEKRGRVGGIIFLLSSLFIVALGILAGKSIGLGAIILAGWRLVGLLAFLFLSKTWQNKDIINRCAVTTYKSLLTYKPFLLYLIPWLMFSLINSLTIPIQSTMIETMQASGTNIQSIEYLRGIENVVTAIFAVAGGFLADFVGRKRMAIIGFIMLGLGYSFLGILSANPLSWYFYTFLDGAAWGIFFVIFVITIWSDISNGLASEKYYAIGVLPFFISYFLRFTIGFDLSLVVSKEAIFSFVAFFLFLAVLPLIYAPETLPEKAIKDRELKGYIEKARKVREKYS